MRYIVHILPYKKSYSAFVPDLPGCVAAGKSIEEVRNLIAEAIGLYIDLMKQNGERVPRPSRRFDLRIDEMDEGELCASVEARMPILV